VRRTRSSASHGSRGSYLCSIIEEFPAWTKTRYNGLSGWTHFAQQKRTNLAISTMTNHAINVLSRLTQALPVGTNLAQLHFLWMLVSGALLSSRGALFPGLKSTGLTDAATRRAWVAFRIGVWQIPALLILWREQIQSHPDWKALRYEGYPPICAS
jgi:hypothetical protein